LFTCLVTLFKHQIFIPGERRAEVVDINEGVAIVDFKKEREQKKERKQDHCADVV
jgi:hypothetical protein